MEKPNPNDATCILNEEDEDTLSLSGLYMYSDKNIEFLVYNPSMSPDFDQDFEFSSEMLVTSQNSSNPVVFCGKVMQVSPRNIEMFERKKQLKRRDQTNTKSRWYVFMFGYGSSRYPKKMHIGDLRERQTSCKRKLCGDCSICRHRNDGRSRSRGFIRFLGCGGGGGTEIDHHEIPPCQLYY